MNADVPLPVTQLLAQGPLGGGEIVLNNAVAPASEGTNLIQVQSGSTLSVDATDNGKGGTITLSSFDGLDITHEQRRSQR